MAVIAKTRLRIRDQSELLNQIAGTYKDFFRAAMEYIDNSVDAATMAEHAGIALKPTLEIHVDTVRKTISFTDNCGGMSPQELCDLLSEVGRSKKKKVAWANGQFGFGVHAFRAFAREATFFSRKKGYPEARITTNRSHDETKDVACQTTETKQLRSAGTRVLISKFDQQVFKRSVFLKNLVSEIEHHFDDVLRAGAMRISVTEDDAKPYACTYFDYQKLPGVTFQRTVPVHIDGDSKPRNITVDLKILDRVQENRVPILTNKHRRIAALADLKSYKTFARIAGNTVYVWSNPFVVGTIETNDICSPNLTRDDLRDSPARDALYDEILKIQKELQALVDDTMNRKVQESFKNLSDIMSKCLANILRGFRLQFEQPLPTSRPGQLEEELSSSEGDVSFGGQEEGGGGAGRGDLATDSGEGGDGRSGPGSGNSGGGRDALSKSRQSGTSEAVPGPSSGPRIEFQNHADADRVIDLGNSLIVNTQHADFIARNSGRSGTIRLDARLLNYVALVVSPPCVHRLFLRRGKVPSALEAGANIVDLSMRLEHELATAVLGQEIDTVQ
jgi:hypothetical protein